MHNLLREDDVEADNEVAAGTLSLGHLLGHGVCDDIASDCAGHAFSWHAKLGLRRDDLGRCNEDPPVVEGVHGNGLHL